MTAGDIFLPSAKRPEGRAARPAGQATSGNVLGRVAGLRGSFLRFPPIKATKPELPRQRAWRSGPTRTKSIAYNFQKSSNQVQISKGRYESTYFFMLIPNHPT